MKKSLAVLLKEYKDRINNFSSIETALAGVMTGKEEENELTDDEIKKAQEVTSDIDELSDYIELGNALDIEDDETVHGILARYGYPIEESTLVDKDMLQLEGYTYSGKFPTNLIEKIARYLDENEIDYLMDGEGEFQIKLPTKDLDYKVVRGIDRIMSKNNPHYVRDNVNQDNTNSIREAKKKKKPAKPKDPNWKTMLDKRTSGAAGAHTDNKYNKQERQKGKHIAKQGVYDEK